MPLNLTRVRQKFSKKYGEQSMLLASDTKALAHIPYGVGAQCLMLDLALGRPGFPAGRMTEIVGKTNQGKSTLCYHALAQCQRQGGVSVLFETEQAFEEWRLRDLGIDTSALLLDQPEDVEQLYEKMEALILELREGQHFQGPITLAVDTIAALTSASEREAKYDEQMVAAAAKAHAFGWRKFAWILAKHKVVLLFLNQLTQTMEKYGEQLTSYGGTAIHKHASARLHLNSRKADIVYVGPRAISAVTNVSMLKNKLEAPFAKDVKYLLDFKTGIDQIEDLWLAARRLKVLMPTQKGAKFALNGKSIIVTHEHFADFVHSKFKSPAALRERLAHVALEQKLMRAYGENS